MDTIEFSDFLKLDIRVGKVVKAEAVEDSDKLIKTTVDFGELGERIIVSGIREWHKPEDLVGMHLPYIVNLEPKKILGIESQGMLLAAAPINADGKKSAVLLKAIDGVEPGTKVI